MMGITKRSITQLDFASSKWTKEIANFKKFKRDVNGDFFKNERFAIDEFLRSGNNGFLRLYSLLSGIYSEIAVYNHLDSENRPDIVHYTYLSGQALLTAKRIYEKGVRVGVEHLDRIVKNSIEQGFERALFQMIAVDRIDDPWLSVAENHLILLMYYNRYDQARVILEQLPESSNGLEQQEKLLSIALKPIYYAIINHDEETFNCELALRIKEYRRSMIGYSTLLDIPAVALIKIAERAGIRSFIDVVEIPKVFFNIPKEFTSNLELPYFQQFRAWFAEQ
ncbi:MAG: hypothetical protein J6L81_04100 [Clostridia bacterium]|nr:hypothetical protein [Clostridia bacterium]